jgi:hypothetical protein
MTAYLYFDVHFHSMHGLQIQQCSSDGDMLNHCICIFSSMYELQLHIISYSISSLHQTSTLCVCVFVCVWGGGRLHNALLS